MARDWVGERVLGIGVDVHLDNAVAQRFFDLFLFGTGAAVEDEVEWVRTSGEAELFFGNLLAHVQNLRAQLHVAWFVHAVHVSEGRGQQVAAVFAGA